MTTFPNSPRLVKSGIVPIDAETAAVAAAPAARTAQQPRPLLQRSCACGNMQHSGECESCRKKRTTLQRRATGRQWPLTVPPVVDNVLATAGHPLATSTRAFMESRFHTDFSTVRVHADDAAARSAAAIDASAYTAGSHLVFGRGAYKPDSPAGAHLLAHELSHVVQQRHMRPQRSTDLEIDPPGSPREHEADRLAHQVMSGSDVAVSNRAGRAIVNRQPAATPPAGASPSPAAPTASAAPERFKWSEDAIDLGRYTNFHHGFADARLDRGPALDAAREGTPGPCVLDLFLAVSFDFYRGAPPAGDAASRATSSHERWPKDLADKWKRDYMRIAQQMWRTRHPLQPVSPCPGEPCTQAVGRLRVVDAETLTDSEGVPVPREKLSKLGYHVTVYEFRSTVQAKDYSHVEGFEATLYSEDVLPLGTPPPKGFDQTNKPWRPGGAAHETGHMLGRPHVNCPPDEYQEAEKCYGETTEQKANVMGRGSDFSFDDHAPFLAAMKSLTKGCAWQVQTQSPSSKSDGWPWWKYALLFLPVVGWAALGILALTGH